MLDVVTIEYVCPWLSPEPAPLSVNCVVPNGPPARRSGKALA
jgi:hypothetical protein